jgi:hypothetical protein
MDSNHRYLVKPVLGRDTLSSLPGSGAIKPMPEAELAKTVQLLDLMLEFFADDGRWTRGSYDDGNGGHCLVGARLHLSRRHRLPTAPAIALLHDAMPRPGLPLVHFNDSRCGSAAELRSIIVRAPVWPVTMRSESGQPPRLRPDCSPKSRKNEPRRRRMSWKWRRTSRSSPNASPPSERPEAGERHSPSPDAFGEIQDGHPVCHSREAARRFFA